MKHINNPAADVLTFNTSKQIKEQFNELTNDMPSYMYMKEYFFIVFKVLLSTNIIIKNMLLSIIAYLHIINF